MEQSRLEAIEQKLKNHQEICYRDVHRLGERTVVDYENAIDDIEWLIAQLKKFKELNNTL